MMNNSDEAIEQGRPAIYRIRVRGPVSERWSSWFDGMSMTLEPMDEEQVITALEGQVEDQAALMGLMQKLYSLGHLLLEVKMLRPALQERSRG